MKMKSKPILFNAKMINAILDGKKTQTRRIRKTGAYGEVGDMLWVRETHTFVANEFMVQAGVVYRADGKIIWHKGNMPQLNDKIVYNVNKPKVWKWRPSIHMPKWANRISLEIIKIKQERLISITKSDRMAEGFCHLADFIETWDEINAKRGWYSWYDNPIVQVIEFKVQETK